MKNRAKISVLCWVTTMYHTGIKTRREREGWVYYSDATSRRNLMKN